MTLSFSIFILSDIFSESSLEIDSTFKDSLIFGVIIFSLVFFCVWVALLLTGLGLSKNAAQKSKTDIDKAMAIKTFLLSI